jgi:stage II sporulation protein GA (sporulation sigma-E factor processing peptidase)
VTVTLYLDVFFAVNFGMDYLLLSLVKRLLHLPASWPRLFAAAFVGAVWACVDLLFPIPGPWAEFFLSWFVTGAAMMMVAFGKNTSGEGITDRKWKMLSELSHLAGCLAAFWMVSVMAGGILSALGEPNEAGCYLSGTRAVRQWKMLPLCFWAAGIYFGLCGCMRAVQRKKKRQEALVRVRISYQGTEKTVTALWDTGNQLCEPYGGQPVHVVTGRVCKELCRTVPGMIYIPFRTVGLEGGVLPAIRVDFMEVEWGGRVVRRYERPWLAISKRPLSLTHQYEMLLHGEKS